MGLRSRNQREVGAASRRIGKSLRHIPNYSEAKNRYNN
jgi:hypothetical protein